MTKLEFILSKNLGDGEFSAVRMEGLSSYSIKRETEKAKLLEWHTDFGKVSSWVPTSCIDDQIKKSNIAAKKVLSELNYEVGEKVSHKTFGVGTVTNYSNPIVTVDFINVGIKKLSADLAKLEKI